jgi:hypothetical protein
MSPDPLPAPLAAPPIRLIELPEASANGSQTAFDPALTMQTCANCGATMIERKCKLICTCGYFLSCSDYY